MTMEQLVNAIVPNMPSDRHVKATRDVMTWYKIINTTRTLLVPPINILRANVRELEKFSEALSAFAANEIEDPVYRWGDEDLVLEEATGFAIAPILKQLPDKAREFGGLVAVDIETRRVEWEDNLLLAIGFAYGPNHCLALHNIPIPGAKYDGMDLPPSVIQSIWEALNEVLNQPDLTYIWHNGKFDCGRLKYICNIDARVDEDTMLQHYVQVNEKQGTHGLKDLGQLYLQAPAWDDELDKIKREWCRKRKVPLKEFTYDSIPTETLIPYMQRDCIATYRLHHMFNKIARPGSEFIYKQLCRASNVYGSMELAGQLIDVEYFF